MRTRSTMHTFFLRTIKMMYSQSVRTFRMEHKNCRTRAPIWVYTEFKSKWWSFINKTKSLDFYFPFQSSYPFISNNITLTFYWYFIWKLHCNKTFWNVCWELKIILWMIYDSLEYILRWLLRIGRSTSLLISPSANFFKLNILHLLDCPMSATYFSFHFYSYSHTLASQMIYL